jgi:UDP-glucose 4-epimerase
LSLNGKRVLVTGGSGFIGSHLCRRLVEDGAEVYVMVKYNSVIDNVRLVSVWNTITPVEADIRNPDSLSALRNIQPDIIYHLAAYNHVGDSFSQVSEAVNSNGIGTVNMLEAYDGYERFVYISSSEVYGYQETVPFREDAAPCPLSPYAVGKYMGELYARMRWHSANNPVVVIRPFNAYGPYQSPRAVIAETIIKCLLGEELLTTEGKQTREFNFVGNLVDGFILAAESPKAVGNIINLGCGHEVSIRDLVLKIHSLTHSDSPLRIGELDTRSGEIWRMCADNAIAKKLLEWEPKVSLEDGLKVTAEWYRRYLEEFTQPNSALARLGI